MEVIDAPAKQLTRYSHTGAPTSYREEYCEQLIEYFERGFTESVRALAPVLTEEETSTGGKQKREVRHICAELPTFEGFAALIGVSSKCLLEWGNRHPAFGVARARAKDIQTRLLVDRGLTRQYDSTAFTFVAKNMLGWRDKIDIDQTTTAGGDSASMDKVRDALGRATPDQLEAFTTLLDRMAQQPLAIQQTSDK